MNITNEDNMALMARYPDNYFELAIVDPPYGIDIANMSLGSNKNKSKTGTGESIPSQLKKARFSQGGGKLTNRMLNKSSLDWDVKPDDRYFKELFRVSKNQIIWGGNYFDLPPTRCVICFDKIQPWENFSQWEMAWTSFDKTASLFRHSTRGGDNLEKKIHPTQKPVKLYEWLLHKYAKVGDKILDTHLGSGSIAIACHNLKFDLTACELDKEYFDSAMVRIPSHINQKRLF